MKILIIGAGLAGVVAQNALSNHDLSIVDKKLDPDIFGDHSAVMRFRDDRLANLLGISLKEVTVYKAYALGGQLCTEPNITANNCYSLKTHESLSERSLKDCGVQKRYLFDSSIKAQRVISGATLKCIYKEYDIDTGEKFIAQFSSSQMNTFEIQYDYCISTIPMPTILKAAGIKHSIIFGSEVIHVYTAKINIPSDVHQTIYFPEADDPAYRITIEGQRIIAESMEELNGNDMCYLVDEFFGLHPNYYDDWKHSKQIGKLREVDSNRRKAMMVQLNKLNIYSLGRYATWRSIRADHLVGDIERIKHFINVSSEVRNYEGNINPEYSSCKGDDNPITIDETS